jgi:hypothetical protein
MSIESRVGLRQGVTQRDSFVALQCTSVPFVARTTMHLSRSSARTSTSERVALLRSQRRSRGFKSHHLHHQIPWPGGMYSQETAPSPGACTTSVPQKSAVASAVAPLDLASRASRNISSSFSATGRSTRSGREP